MVLAVSGLLDAANFKPPTFDSLMRLRLTLRVILLWKMLFMKYVLVLWGFNIFLKKTSPFGPSSLRSNVVFATLRLTSSRQFRFTQMFKFIPDELA